MKLALLITLMIIIYLIRKNKTSIARETLKAPSKMYSLNDGNQSNLLISVNINSEWLKSLKEKYDWNNFDEYDNRMWEYMYKLFDEAMEKSEIRDYNKLWNNLNRQQKIFWAFLSFNGDTDNGGVYQFVFNKPEFLVAVNETFKELGLKKLEVDYYNVIKELTGKKSKIDELKSVFNNQSTSWNKRWNSFAEGYKELKSTEVIEKYYYDREFKKTLYKTVSDYIEQNIDKFAVIA